MSTTQKMVPSDLGRLSDHDLLAGGLSDQMAENRYAAQRLARLDELRCRLEQNYEARKANQPRFTLTPLREAAIEASELWGLETGRVMADARKVRNLRTHFPGVWELCLNGQLDLYRASIIEESAKYSLDRPREFARFAERITAWLNGGIPDHDGRPPLVNRTVRQLRNKISYEIRKLKPKDAEERFKRGFKARGVRTDLGEDGMGYLSINNTVNQVQVADYRLTLLARALRAKGDERTLEQLRADLAVDLIVGRVVGGATTGEFEDEETADGSDPADTIRALPTSNYARPIINVTVPIQTLMGISDEPGTLSGGTVIPVALARKIAQDPTSTWFRMLTDKQGQFMELSTKSYQPTQVIWRNVVARESSCYRRNCSVPATACELDHRVAWPKGLTSTANLGPGCKSDHTGKHADGFGLERNPDGTLTFRTRAGFSHITEPVEHPVSDEWPDADLLESQFTATEILGAIQILQDEQELIRSFEESVYDFDELWEDSGGLRIERCQHDRTESASTVGVGSSE